MLAGGGVRPGTVLGASDSLGAYPESDRVGPEELHATLHHCLGIAPSAEIVDRFNRPLKAVEGEPISAILR